MENQKSVSLESIIPSIQRNSGYVQNIFAQQSTFVGRAYELANIEELFKNPSCRLLTLVGFGGIGKTRIACEAATRVTDAFAHGSYFVALAPISSPDIIASTIASSIGLLLIGAESPRTQLIDYLRKRELLLVLDNFEHLMSAVDLIIEILEAAPNVRLLVTSRERLNIHQEWVLDIYGLEYPQDEIIYPVEQYSAIHFFLKCAYRVKPDFRLIETIQSSVIRICRLVEGMPLGIELAASWVRTLSCQAIADEIERNLDFLASSQRNMPQKHRSMRAVFDQSYNLLTEEQQQVFRKLSVFRGGFRPQAAAAVANASLMTLAALVDKSLLRVSTEGRYDMHELLRQYGEDHLRATDIVDSVHDAHSSTYADFIHQRVDDLKGRRQLEALAEINADFENVRTAWNWASDHNNADRINKMLDGLTLFCSLRSRIQESWALTQHAKNQFAEDHRFERVWGRLVSHAPEQITALQHELQTALQIAQHYDDVVEIASCLLRLGTDALEKRDLAKSKQLFEQSLMYYRQLGDHYWVACTLFNLMLIGHEESWHNFKVYGEESLRLRREIGDRIGEAWSIAPVAIGEGRVGHFAEAERLWLERIKLGQETGSSYLTAIGYGHLSYQVYFIQGDFDKTRTAAEQALKIGTTLNYPNAIGCGLITLGMLASLEERYEEGKALCQKGISIKVLPYVSDLAAWGLSIAACGLGDYTAAGDYLSTTFKYIFYSRGLTGIVAGLPIAAILLTHKGNPERAVELLALAFTHPVHASGWIEKWPLLGRLLSSLEQELGYETYTTAWERGMLLDLDAVVAELRQQFQRNPILSKGKETSSPTTPLSERELEVLRLVAEGCSNPEIADRLYVGVSTVKKHINHIYDKLDAKNRTQAVAIARKQQLLTP